MVARSPLGRGHSPRPVQERARPCRGGQGRRARSGGAYGRGGRTGRPDRQSDRSGRGRPCGSGEPTPAGPRRGPADVVDVRPAGDRPARGAVARGDRGPPTRGRGRHRCRAPRSGPWVVRGRGGHHRGDRVVAPPRARGAGQRRCRLPRAHPPTRGRAGRSRSAGGASDGRPGPGRRRPTVGKPGCGDTRPRPDTTGLPHRRLGCSGAHDPGYQSPAGGPLRSGGGRARVGDGRRVRGVAGRRLRPVGLRSLVCRRPAGRPRGGRVCRGSRHPSRRSGPGPSHPGDPGLLPGGIGTVLPGSVRARSDPGAHGTGPLG